MTMENRGPQLQAAAIGLLALSLIAFVQRAFVRAYMVKAFGVDDWLMLGAMVAFIFFVTCVLSGIHYGTGRHMRDLSTLDQDMALMYWYFCYIGYCWTMILSKLSIGAFLLRIVVATLHRWILYTAIFINILTGIIFFFVTTLQCSPISYFWNKETQAGTCIPIDIIIVLTYIYSSFNIVCDFTFALLPIAIVQGLNMPRRLKIAIVPLLGMGCIASSAVVVRLAYIETFRDPDFLWATTDIAIWSTTEGGLAIAAGSLACGRPLFKIILSRFGFFSSTPYVVPSHEALGGGPGRLPTVGSPRGSSRRSWGTELFSLGSSMFTAHGGGTRVSRRGELGDDDGGGSSSTEDLKRQASAEEDDCGRKPRAAARHVPIQVKIDEVYNKEAVAGKTTPPPPPPSQLDIEQQQQSPRRGRSSASDGTFSSRRELRQDV